MPIFEDSGPINYNEFLREQRGLNDKIARREWKKLIEELCPPDETSEQEDDESK